MAKQDSDGNCGKTNKIFGNGWNKSLSEVVGVEVHYQAKCEYYVYIPKSLFWVQNWLKFKRLWTPAVQEDNGLISDKTGYTYIWWSGVKSFNFVRCQGTWPYWNCWISMSFCISSVFEIFHVILLLIMWSMWMFQMQQYYMDDYWFIEKY